MSAPPKELTELSSQVRALREENSRLGARLDRLEMTQVALPGTRAKAPPVESTPTNWADEGMPPLTVIKLKPKKEAAPKLATDVAVAEPANEVVAEYSNVPSEEAAQPPSGGSVGDVIFEKGLQALKTGNVAGGVDLLQRFAAEQPKHAKADNALYFAGMGLMGLEDFEDAARTFEDVASRYPAGDIVSDAILKLGECRMRQGKPIEAQKSYRQLIANFPGTAAAQAAQARLQGLTKTLAATNP